MSWNDENLYLYYFDIQTPQEVSGVNDAIYTVCDLHVGRKIFFFFLKRALINAKI